MKKIINGLIVALGIVVTLFVKAKHKEIKRLKHDIGIKDEQLKKIAVNNTILSDWIGILAKGETLQEWLKFKGYRKVAIYGYGVLGRTLESTLMNDGITVQCIVDKNYENISSNVLCVSPNNVPLVDAMIVSVVSEYDEIETEAILRYDFPIISIEDVIYGTGGIR